MEKLNSFSVNVLLLVDKIVLRFITVYIINNVLELKFITEHTTQYNHTNNSMLAT